MKIYCSTRENREYYTALAEGVVREYNDYWKSDDLDYEITADAISFMESGNVLYIQRIADIYANPDDLEADIEQLAEEVIGAAIPNF
jgi:hypothetical protein